MKNRQVDLVLDSGAYSAWKKRESLTVEMYLEFIEEYADILHQVVNLDVIPGHWGHIPSAREVDDSAAKGWKNLLFLRKHGVNAMPVFHQGERMVWLEKMLDEGFQYIGISPANDRTTDEKREWLDGVFGLLCGSSGYPEVATHGFGVTALSLLYRYPWFSADSVTWLLVGGYGGILVPRSDGKGGYSYDNSPMVVTLSRRGGKSVRKVSADLTRHYDTCGPQTRKYIKQYCNQQGWSMSDLRENYISRQLANCRFFKDLASLHTVQPFVQKKKIGFFNSSGPPSKRGQTEPLDHFRMVFTTTTSQNHSDILQTEGCRDRLLTYYYFQKRPPFSLREYVKTGRIPSKRKSMAATLPGLRGDEQ